MILVGHSAGGIVVSSASAVSKGPGERRVFRGPMTFPGQAGYFCEASRFGSTLGTSHDGVNRLDNDE